MQKGNYTPISVEIKLIYDADIITTSAETDPKVDDFYGENDW